MLKLSNNNATINVNLRKWFQTAKATESNYLSYLSDDPNKVKQMSGSVYPKIQKNVITAQD